MLFFFEINSLKANKYEIYHKFNKKKTDTKQTKIKFNLNR